MTTAGSAERSGVLVVRAWIEGDPPQLKARLTHTVDLVQGERELATVSSPKEIHDEIERWLEALEAGPRR